MKNASALLISGACGALLALASAPAAAQATYARGDTVWTNTTAAVGGGATMCTSCHNGAGAPNLATLRTRFQALAQPQVRLRIDQAFAVAPMNGVYMGATAILGTDRDALSIYFGNFIADAGVTSAGLTTFAAAVGQTVTTNFTITNTSMTPLMVTAVTLAGTNAGDFSRMPVGNGCAAQTIAAAASCTEMIRFTPTATGARVATLMVMHNRNPLGTTYAMSGTATAATGGGGGGTGGGGGGGGVGGTTPTNAGAGGALWPWLLLVLLAIRRRAD